MNGELIRKSVKERGWTIGEAAGFLGISTSYLTCLINGYKKNPTLDVLESISSLFGLPIDQLRSGGKQNAIKKNPKEKKISLRKLAELTEIPKSSLHDMESGKKIPKEAELEVIAKVLGVTKEEVMGWK